MRRSAISSKTLIAYSDPVQRRAARVQLNCPFVGASRNEKNATGALSMSRKQIAIGLVAVAVITLGIAAYFMFGPGADQPSALPAAADRIQVQLTAYDRRMGSPNADPDGLNMRRPVARGARAST